MDRSKALMVGALLASTAASPVAAQMHSPGNMTGARHSAINLVSPIGSVAQLGRGMIAIGQPMGMMMQPSQPSSRAVVVQLRLAGVSSPNGLLTSSGNRLLFDGRLASAASGETPVAVDEAFDLRDGAALVRVQIPIPSLNEPARLLIDRIEVSDAGGETFAVPGIAIAQPAATGTPRPTPRGGCQSSAECDDGRPETQDLCMPMGCIHRPTHMGGGPMH